MPVPKVRFSIPFNNCYSISQPGFLKKGASAVLLCFPANVKAVTENNMKKV